MVDSPLDNGGLRSLRVGKTSQNSRTETSNYFPRDDSHHSFFLNGHFLKRKYGGFDQYIEAMVEILLLDSVESFLYLNPQTNFSIREQSNTNFLEEFLGRQEVGHSTPFERRGTDEIIDSQSSKLSKEGEERESGDYLESKKELETLLVPKEGFAILKVTNLVQSKSVNRNMREREGGGSQEIGPQVWADGEREGEMEEDWERKVKGKEGEGDEWLGAGEVVKGGGKQDGEGEEEGKEETDEDESDDESEDEDEDKVNDKEEIVCENDGQRHQIRFTLKTVEVHPHTILEQPLVLSSSATASSSFQESGVVPVKLLLDRTVLDKEHHLGSPVKTDVKTDVETDIVKTDVKLDAETDAKTDFKTDVKTTDVKTDIETDVKAGVKTDVKTEVKTDIETEERPSLIGDERVEASSSSGQSESGDLVEKKFVFFTSKLSDQDRAVEIIDLHETNNLPLISEEGREKSTGDSPVSFEEGREKTIKDSHLLSEGGGIALFSGASIVTSDEKKSKILNDIDKISRTPEPETEGVPEKMTESESSRVESNLLSGNLGEREVEVGEGEVIPLEESTVSKDNEVVQTFSEGPKGNRKKWQSNLGGWTVMSSLLPEEERGERGERGERQNSPTQEVHSQDSGTSFREQDDAVTEIEKEKGGGEIALSDKEDSVESVTVLESNERREVAGTSFAENINSKENFGEAFEKVLPEGAKSKEFDGGKQEGLVEDEVDVKEMVSYVPLDKIMVVESTVEITKRGRGNELNREVDFQQSKLTSGHEIGGGDVLGQSTLRGIKHVLEEVKQKTGLFQENDLVEVKVSEVSIPLKSYQVEKIEDGIEKKVEEASAVSGNGDRIEKEMPIFYVSSLQNSVPISLVTEIDGTTVDKPYLLKDLNEVDGIPLSDNFVRVNSTHFPPPTLIPAAFLAPLQRFSTENSGSGSFFDERLETENQKDITETSTENIETATGTSTSPAVTNPTVSTNNVFTEYYNKHQDWMETSIPLTVVYHSSEKTSPKKEKEKKGEEEESNVHVKEFADSTKGNGLSGEKVEALRGGKEEALRGGKEEVLRGEKKEALSGEKIEDHSVGQPQPVKKASRVISSTSSEDFVSVAKKGGFACCFRPQVKRD